MLPVFGISQEEITVEQYIDTYKAIAIREMERHQIPASITLAQGILESGCGNSTLAREANNHFGIKCHEGWTGQTFHKDDDEKDECFRKYKDPEESYVDHSEFLKNRDRYRFLFDLDRTDYKGWAHGLKKAGYATNPRYPEMLIRIIEENGLANLDLASERQLAAGSQSGNSPLQKPESGYPNPGQTTAPTSFDIAGRGGNDRIIFKNNGVKFILAREGDDARKIAAEFEIYTWQVHNYNEMDKDDAFLAGQKVYLEKKKSRSSDFKRHFLEEGENLKSVSQDFGIRLSSLERMNGLSRKDSLDKGLEIRLR